MHMSAARQEVGWHKMVTGGLVLDAYVLGTPTGYWWTVAHQLLVLLCSPGMSEGNWMQPETGLAKALSLALNAAAVGGEGAAQARKGGCA